MKRMLSLFLILVVFCGGAAAEQDADALTVQADGITYSISIQNGEATLLDASRTSGPVTVPSYVNGFPVTAVGDGAFKRTQVPSVILPDTVRSVGEDAFYESGVISVTLGRGLKEIGNAAFYGCYLLRQVELPEGLVKLDPYAFAGCESLEEVTLPEGLTEVPDHAFDYCSALRRIFFPDTITAIGSDAFAGCESLETLTLPKSLKVLGDSAFRFCTSLRSAALPEGLRTIGTSAFARCKALDSLTIPSTVESMNKFSFEHTPWYDSLLGDFPTAGAGVLLEYRGSDKVVTVPDGILTIGGRAFFQNETVEQVILPDSVRSIEWSAFDACAGLRSINIPPQAAVAGSSFEDTPWLEENKDPFIVAGDGYLLRYNGAGTEATVPEGVKVICHNAFYCGFMDGDRKVPAWPLKKVVLPDSLQKIEQDAFRYCENLVDVVFPNHAVESQQAFVGTPYALLNGTGYVLDGGAIYSADRKALIRVLPDVQTLRIPEGVTWLFDPLHRLYYPGSGFYMNPASSVFSSAYSLETLEIPASLSADTLADHLTRAPGLKEIKVSQDNPVYSSVDGVLYDHSRRKLLYSPKHRDGAEDIVSSTVPDRKEDAQ